MRHLVLIVHNVRSAYNVGSILRTCDALAVEMVYLTGYTPFPKLQKDMRLPHISDRIDRRIAKTALGAQESLPWSHHRQMNGVVMDLKRRRFIVIALELTDKARPLAEIRPSNRIAMIVGNELDGIEDSALKAADEHAMIPMLGDKESLNVSVAASIALYHFRFVA